MFLALLAAVLLFLGWVFLEVWQVYTAEPKATVDYRAQLRELAEKNAGVSPEEADDSWRLVVDAMEGYKEAERQISDELAQSGFSSRGTFDDGQVDFDYPMFGSILPDDVDRERQCLQRIRELGVSQLLDRLSTSKIGLRPVEGSGPLSNDSLSHVLWVNRIVKSQAASFRISAMEGDSKQLVEAFKHGLRLAETISYQPTDTEYWSGASMATLILDELQSSLVERDLSPDVYPALAEMLHEFSPSRAVFSLECERIHYHDLADRVFTGDGGGFVTSYSEGLTSSGRENTFLNAIIARFYLATKQDLEHEIDTLMNWLIAESKVEPTQVNLRGKYEQRRVELYVSGRYPFIEDLFGIPEHSIGIEDALQVEISATLVMIAIAEYKVRQGNYPAHLDDLVPEILAVVPIDPLHGGAFRYRLTPDDPHGRPYLLYSTGLDRKDDGGDFDLTDSLRCIDDPNARTDYTVNQPRRSMAEYWDDFR